MNKELYIQFHQDKTSKLSLGYVPFFYHEIAFGYILEPFEGILTEEEEELFYPYINGVHEYDLPAILPEEFKAIVLKIWNFLETNQHLLPVEYFIDRIEDKSFQMEDSKFESYKGIIYKNSKCYLDVDTLSYNVSGGIEGKARVLSRPREPDVVDFWIMVKERVSIDGRPYRITVETRFQRYKDQLTLLIEFCDKAIRENKKINWISI